MNQAILSAQQPFTVTLLPSNYIYWYLEVKIILWLSKHMEKASHVHDIHVLFLLAEYHFTS